MDCSVIISAAISSTISVIGWFVVYKLDRKARKEESQMQAYEKIFNKTNDLIRELSEFNYKMHEHMNVIGNAVKENKRKGNDQPSLETWLKGMNSVIDEVAKIDISIKSYVRIMKMSKTDYGTNQQLYYDISSIYYDTQKALLLITGLWVNSINYESNTIDTSLESIRSSTEESLKQLDEFTKCLEDILVHIYNLYVAKPLNIAKIEIQNTDNRRYISENGIIDNRHLG